MSSIRSRIRNIESVLDEFDVTRPDERSEIVQWLTILRMVRDRSDRVEQTPDLVTALGRIHRTIAAIEPFEHVNGGPHLEYQCMGARYQLSWPGFPSPWDNPEYETRIAESIAIDQSRRSFADAQIATP